MPFLKHRRVRAWQLPAALALVLGACGDPTAPLPPPSDIAAPVVQISSPSQGAVIQDTLVVISGTVTDDRKVVRITYQIGDQPSASVEVVQGPAAQFGITIPLLEDSVTVRVLATDSAGNVGGTQLRVSGTVPRYRQLSIGDEHVCAVSTLGNAYCWGANATGSLGVPAGPASQTPVRVSGGVRFQSVSAGGHFGGSASSCGLTADGSAYCWGEAREAQLGVPSATNTSTPTRVQGVPPLASIAIGGYHVCGLTPAGEAYCWAANFIGQGGVGKISDVIVPTAVVGGLRFAALDAAYEYTCGVTTTGEIYCWGNGGDLQFETRPTYYRSDPVRVPSDQRFVAISTGDSHACARTGDGAAYCWGRNSSGKLGLGAAATAYSYSTPQRVQTQSPLAAVSAGGREHSCALTREGVPLCWGRKEFNPGALFSGAVFSEPTPTPGGLRFASISAEGFQACALTAGGRAYCWDGVAAVPSRVAYPKS